MAVCTDHVTLGYLCFQLVQRISFAAECGHCFYLISLVVKLKNYDIILSAIHTRVLAEIFNQEFRICSVSLSIAVLCHTNIP